MHNLSGPFRVEDKEGKPALPGDLLVVEICDLGPLTGYEWGFTGIFDRENGGGFLTDHFPEACKAIWDFEGIYCSSRHVPGAFCCLCFNVSMLQPLNPPVCLALSVTVAKHCFPIRRVNSTSQHG